MGPDCPDRAGVVRSRLVSVGPAYGVAGRLETTDRGLETSRSGLQVRRGVFRPPLILALVLLGLTEACGPVAPSESTPSPEGRATSAPTLTAAPAPSATAVLLTPAATGRPCDTGGTWNLELAVTGGLVGVDQRLELDQTGAYRAIDQRDKTTLEGTLPSEAMTDVIGNLPSVCSTPSVTRPPACADCYTYSLQATLDGRQYEIALNDANLAQSAAGELVGLLSRLLSSALDY